MIKIVFKLKRKVNSSYKSRAEILPKAKARKLRNIIKEKAQLRESIKAILVGMQNDTTLPTAKIRK